MPEERKEKFTPGPWRYRPDYEDVTDQYESPIADLVGISYAECGPNGYLIAAAPELYKCLQSILADCIIRDYYRGPAEALLAKARGEEEKE